MKSSAQIWVALGVAISLFGTVCGLSAIINHRASNDTVEISRSRTERSLMFPYNSALGLIVAIAVPLKVPDRNIFMSYNFEGNYNSPQSTNVFTEGFFNWVRGIAPVLETPAIAINRALDGDPEVESAESTTAADEEESPKVTRAIHTRTPIYTRKKVYRAIESQFIKNGFNGKKCLLRLICEASEIPVHEHNGILGDLFHIVLSPSTSKDENLPPEFYKAERFGVQGHCHKYRKHCQENVFDLFSVIM
ncbi:hypothetical protein quinque_011485 [Culex quinquefasciatus]